MSWTTEVVEVDRAGPGLAPRPPRLLVPSLSGARRNRRPGLLTGLGEAVEQRRLFVLLPFASVAGLIVSLQSTAPPEPLTLCLVALALVVTLVAAAASAWTFRIALLLCAFWAGFCLLPLHGALSGTEMLSRPAYGAFEARVDEIVSETESGKRAIISAITPMADTRAVPMRRARIVISGGPDLSPGDVIRAPIRFYPVPGPVVPGGHDTQFHSFFDGIGAYGSATGTVVLVRSGEAAPERVVNGIRQGIARRIDAQLTQPAAGIARAIVNGDQSAVTDAAREVMATAGLAHVLSISGLHLTIVAGGAYFVLRLLFSLSHALARRISVKRFAAVGGIVAALAYFSISGGNVAALRSTIMIILVFGAVLFGRRALTMRNVAIAALIVIGRDPPSVFRPSFQLSFAAVVALVGAYEMIRRDRERHTGLFAALWRYLAGIGLTSLVAGSATVLFSVYHFQQTSPLGLLGNLAVLPLVSFVMMPSAACAVLLMPFGLEGPFLLAMGWSVDRMLDLGALITQFSGSIDSSPLLTPVALLLGLFALAWFAFFASWHRLIGPALLLPAVLLFALDRPPDVLIADTTQAVAFRAAHGLELVTGKPDTFAVDVWRESYGEPIEAAQAGSVRCDTVGCLARSARGFTLAVIRDPAGFYEDCPSVDLVVTRLVAPGGCAAPTVIDAEDLARGGVHWLRWDARAGPIRNPPGNHQSQPAVASRATLTPAAGMAAPPIT
jgi:competence protein ComEC